MSESGSEEKEQDEPGPEGADAAERPREPAPPADAAAESEHAADLEVELPAGSIVAKRNANVGNTYYIGGDYKDGSASERGLISVADVSDQIAAEEKAFVKPESFDEIVATLARERITVLTGRSRGNRTAAGAALRASGLDPILELPANASAGELVDGIESLCKEHRKAGLLIHSLAPEPLGKLAGFELRRLRAALNGVAAVVITVQGELAGGADTRNLPIVAGTVPNPAAVLAKTAEAQGLSEAARERAAEALGALTPPVSPGTVIELASLAAGSEATAADLAAVLDGRPPALDNWLQERPTARGVAALAAAATLDGAPSGDFESAAEELVQALAEDVEAPSEEKRFGPRAGRDLPIDIVGFGRAAVLTHFGQQEVDVVRIVPPLRHDLVTGYLWRKLDTDFRQPYLEWLKQLAERPLWRLNRGAGITAGVLFVADPIRIERELLRPWALDGGAHQRYSVSLALGIPAASGCDPLPARALAQSWSKAAHPNLRRAAVFVYGGPLGTWDSGADAAAHLWRIPEEAPELRAAADRALASLVTGGRHAARARAAVFGLLHGEVDTKPTPKRVYALLPMLVGRLTAEDRAARDSLAGLVDDSERESLDQLAALLVRSLDAPAGQASAIEALRAMLAATAAGHIGREVLDELLVPRMTAVAAERGRLPQFQSQLERLLKAEGRRRGPLREAARSTHEAIYAKQ
jgi:hypothetical protein